MRVPRLGGSVLCGLVCLLLVCSPSIAGESGASIAGRVLSARGAPVPGVEVVLTRDVAPPETWTITTDREGRFFRDGLPPGDGYRIGVGSERFGEIGAGPARLQAGVTTTIDIRLDDPSSDTATRSSWGSGFIGALPIIGHNYQDILTLTPGVNDTDGDGNPNVHGARETGMLYRLDGGDVTDPATGTYALNLDPLIIDRVDVTTAGAPAAYGRANGGFTEITTRSGGNDLEGAFAIYWRGRALDGDGADNNDVNTYESDDPQWQDLRAAASIGGPILKDRLWYFASLEGIDAERPAGYPGTDLLVTTRGAYGFAKLSLQAGPSDKVTLQAVGDPLNVDGLGSAPGVSADSGYDLSQGGYTTMLAWSSIISPAATLDASFTHLDTGISVTPTSSRFGKVDMPVFNVTTMSGSGLYAYYPCDVPACEPAFGERDVYQIDLVTGQVNGPFYFESNEDRARNMLRADLSWYLGDSLGEHRIRGGLEIGQESYRDDTEIAPLLYDALEPIVFTPGALQPRLHRRAGDPGADPVDAGSRGHRSAARGSTCRIPGSRYRAWPSTSACASIVTTSILPDGSRSTLSPREDVPSRCGVLSVRRPCGREGPPTSPRTARRSIPTTAGRPRPSAATGSILRRRRTWTESTTWCPSWWRWTQTRTGSSIS